MTESLWQEKTARQILRVEQTVIASLVVGVLIFLGVAVVLVRQGVVPAADTPLPMLTYVAVGMAVAGLLAGLIVPGVIVARARQQIVDRKWQMTVVEPAHMAPRLQAAFTEFIQRAGDAGKLLLTHNRSTMVGGAILEGVAFYALTAYLIEHSPLSLWIAIVMLLGVAAHLPTRSRVSRWIEDQLRRVDQQRHSGWQA